MFGDNVKQLILPYMIDEKNTAEVL